MILPEALTMLRKQGLCLIQTMLKIQQELVLILFLMDSKVDHQMQTLMEAALLMFIWPSRKLPFKTANARINYYK